MIRISKSFRIVFNCLLLLAVTGTFEVLAQENAPSKRDASGESVKSQTIQPAVKLIKTVKSTGTAKLTGTAKSTEAAKLTGTVKSIETTKSAETIKSSEKSATGSKAFRADSSALKMPVEMFPMDSELGTGELGTGWSQKKNVHLNWNGAKKSLEMEIGGSEFAFGWFQRILAAADYGQVVGIYGRFLTPKISKSRNAISALLVIPNPGQASEYYSADIGSGNDSQGEWVEFYLPLKKFKPSRDALRNSVTTKMLRSGFSLEISVGGIIEKSQVEFDQFRLLGAEEEKKVKRRIGREQMARNLKSESELTDSQHPRLLLCGKRLERIRAKSQETGIQQDGYNQLIKLAEQAMKKINADEPFGKIFQYEKSAQVNDHVNRGRFEGTINPLVIPLETLAAAAVITGNEKYGRHAAKALVNMARLLDVDTPEIDQGFYYTRTFYVRALAFGYDWLYHYLTPAQRREVKITLFGFIQDIYDRSWINGWGRHPLNRVWNWDPGLVSCAGLGILAMQNETRTAENAMLIQFRRHLRDYLTFGIDFDGCCHEGPSYISYGIGSGIQFAECLRDKGYGDLFTETNWQLIAPWLVSELLPNHPQWNNLSDCNHGSVAGCPVYAYTCGRLAELAKTDPVKEGERLAPQNATLTGLDYPQHFSEAPGHRFLSYGALAELMGWAWNTSSDARNPLAFSDAQTLAFVLFYEDCPVAEDPGRYLPDSLFFRGRGLVVCREGGYGQQAVHFETEAGPHAAGHDQSDKGSFTWRSHGADFVIDSGYGNDGEKEKSGSSKAHNIVLIDGQGQPMNWHNTSNGEITGYSHSDIYDWIRTDARGAWNYSFSQWKEIASGMEVEKADRHYIFIRRNGTAIPPYLIAYDDIRKKDGLEHEFTWQLHTSADFNFEIGKESWTIAQNKDSFQVLTTTLEKTSGKATFTLTAPKSGKYNLVGVTRCAGSDKGKSDSFFVSVNGAPRICWDLVASSNFTWSYVKNRTDFSFIDLDLKAGEQIKCELTSREPEAQLAFLGLIPSGAVLPQNFKDPIENGIVIPATQAVQDKKTPFQLIDSITKHFEANMTVYPVMTPKGRTESAMFETSQNGWHPRLAHSVKAIEPDFLMVMVPRANQKDPLPKIRPLRQSGNIGARIIWPQGKTDTILFRAGQNGKVPEFRRSERTESSNRP